MQEKISSKIELLKRYRDILRFSYFLLPYWKIKFLAIIFSIILAILSLVAPYLTKFMIDKAYGNKDLKLFFYLLIFGAVIFMIQALTEGFYNYFEKKLRLKVNFDINRQVFERLQRLSLRFFQDKSTGEHIFKINFDVERLSYLVSEALPQFILISARFLLILAMVIYLNWKMALVCIFLSPFVYLQNYYFVGKRQEIFDKQIKLNPTRFVRLQEVFSHMLLVKALGKEDYEIKDFFAKLVAKMELALFEMRMQFFNAFTGNGIRRFILGAVSAFGGYQIIKGEMSLGSLTAVMIYFSQLVGLQSSFTGFFEEFSVNLISGERIAQILDRQPEIADLPDAVLVSLSGADIEFKNVTFGYQPGKPVVDNLSFIIKHGTFLALVGPSGCGKTTLLKLLLRLYDTDSGLILAAGYDIKKIKGDCLKRQTGIALQEPLLWNDTAINNIRYAKESAGLEEIKKSAKIAQIDDFIESLPQGYETTIGERASKISEGQKQRIAIARAIVGKPDILILDEAMSSLDYNNEEKIIERIRQEFKSSTVIIVSHRSATVKNMDLVYFLETPAKMSIGGHEELLEINQKYRQLFASHIEPEGSYK